MCDLASPFLKFHVCDSRRASIPSYTSTFYTTPAVVKFSVLLELLLMSTSTRTLEVK